MKVWGLIAVLIVFGSIFSGAVIAENVPEGFGDLVVEAEFFGEKDIFSADQKPTVETRSATSMTETAATLNGEITDDGGATIDERRFDWGTDSSCSDDWTNDVTVSGNSFWYGLNGLDPDTTYYFRARAHNSAGWSNGSVLSFHTAPLQPVWTFMVYLDGDNNLEHAYIRIFELMETASNNPYVNIVVQFDRIHYSDPADDTSYGNWTDCRRFHITPGVTPAPDNEEQILGEVNMADPATLEAFISWAKTNYSADYYLLAVVNHGGGWQPTGEQQLAAADPVPTGIVWDYTNGGDYMSTVELGNALSSASSGGTDKLDVVFLDACLMQMIEVGYEIKDYSQFLVASEYTGWAPGPYDDYISSITSTTTPLQLANIIVDEYHNWLTGTIYAHTMSSINLAQLGNLAQEVDHLAQELTGGLPTYLTQIENSRSDCQKLSRDSYIDLSHFAYLIKQNIADATVQQAAQDVISALNNSVVAEAHESGGGDSLDNTHGISIYFPASQSDQGYNNYNPSNLAFVGDKGWDEFLSAFFFGIPDIRVPFSTLNFGNVTVGNTLDLDRTIYNDGTSTLTVDSITNSFGSSDFTYVGSATPFDIEPGDSRTITVRFAPTSLGQKSANFNVNSNDPDEPHVPFDVFGNGVGEPELSYTPISYNFGDKCGGESDSITFEIWNSGTGTLTYSLSEDCNWADVHPTQESSTGEHDTITVDIDTTGLSEGYHSCNISIISNGGSGTFTVAVNLVELVTPNFDTGSATNPYPSISGTHNGTLTPSCNLRVSTLYTYACTGTGGHTDYAKIFNYSWSIETLPWDGYQSDWHNLSFSKPFTLYENETYNYTIRTDSYPQMIHKSSLNATGGTITCEEFIDANGKRYDNWIPAIKLG
jgi:hypothetical protein